MIQKKPFASVGLAFGQTVFKTGVESFNDDPEFGRMIKTEHSMTEPVTGRIDGIARSEDGKGVNVVITPITKEGEPLHADKENFGAETITLPMDPKQMQDFGENVWCDDRKRVLALCKKLNKEAKSGLIPLLETIKGKLDILDSLDALLEDEEA